MIWFHDTKFCLICLEHSIKAYHNGGTAEGIVLGKRRLPQETERYLRGNVVIESHVGNLDLEAGSFFKNLWFECMARIRLVELDAVKGVKNEHVLEEEGEVAHKVIGIHFCGKVPVCSGSDVHAGGKWIDGLLVYARRDVIIAELFAEEVGYTRFAAQFDSIGPVKI